MKLDYNHLKTHRNRSSCDAKKVVDQGAARADNLGMLLCTIVIEETILFDKNYLINR